MTKKRSDIDRSAVFEAILGDLGSSEPEVAAGSTVPLSAVRFNQRQPRKHVSEEGLRDLAASIRDITKLRGEVSLCRPGELPNDGKVIDDARKYD